MNEKAIEIKWMVLDNAEGTATLSRHAFKYKLKKSFYGDYDSNISLCGKITASEDGEYGMPFAEMVDQGYHPKYCCRTCERLYAKLTN